MQRKNNWKVFLTIFFITLCCAPEARAQAHEIAIGIGTHGNKGTGFSSPQVSRFIGGNAALGPWDIGGRLSQSNFPKVGTPGGSHTTKSIFARLWITPTIFASGGSSWVHGDATVWTKDNVFIGGGIGLRLKSNLGAKRPDEDRFSFGYQKEIKTDAASPNKTSVWSAGWSHDFYLEKAVFLRMGVSFSHVRFLQADKHMRGNGFGAHIAFVMRGKE